MYQELKKIIIDQLDVNEKQITLEASLSNDLGADSLDTVELVMAFEKEFEDEIKCEISEAAKMRTVGDVVNFI